MTQYYFHLKGVEEWIYKQSSMGGVNHIAISGDEYEAAITSPPPHPELRIDTWCGKNLKYGSMSSMIKRDAGIRNCCEYCAIEYDPEDRGGKDREPKARRQILSGDLPF